ncbi:MAG TPA: hypothetical protein VNL71_02325 [Chloroflexota bacterium]|nr:hypothetical protein [Chloroflexota bacterium]
MSVPIAATADPILAVIRAYGACHHAACPVATLLATFPLTRESLEERLGELEGEGLILRTANADGSLDVAVTEAGA